MIYLRNEHYESLQATRDLLQAHAEDMTEDEKKIFLSFCAFHDEAIQDRERHKAKSQASMQRYRNTEEGREKDRARSKEYYHSHKPKK